MLTTHRELRRASFRLFGVLGLLATGMTACAGPGHGRSQASSRLVDGHAREVSEPGQKRGYRLAIPG